MAIGDSNPAAPSSAGDRRPRRSRRSVGSGRPRRTGPRPPTGNRAAALLVAVIAGAVAANLTLGAGAAGSPPRVQDVSAVADALAHVDEEAPAEARVQISESEAAARLQAVAASRAARAEAANQAVLPVQGRLTSSFGPRWGTRHYGLDFAAPMLTQEVAAADGVVLRAGPASGFGLAVYIQHDNGDVTVYGHMDSIQVQAGDIVEAGDPIALLGNRGQSTGPHLHFEVHEGGMNGSRLDPALWLAERGVELPA
ncbi:Peptidase family M23 [Klenkia marina]|uniref:Peptidase family M23 n=1 Tax=Klenkia marina TaxID=1960309 RepID=A0A1G4Z3N1_9ACTN|nr:Peptidase family M23 [Klenkia marina]